MYTKETGRRIKRIQAQTVASTAADVVSDHQMTGINVGDFCTLMCTTGTMYFLHNTTGTVLTSSANGLQMTAGDTLDFVLNSSSPYTLSTAADGKFQLIIWEA